MSFQELNRFVVSWMWLAAWYSSNAAWAFYPSFQAQRFVDSIYSIWIDRGSCILVFSKTLAKGQREILWSNSCVYIIGDHSGVLGGEECDLGQNGGTAERRNGGNKVNPLTQPFICIVILLSLEKLAASTVFQNIYKSNSFQNRDRRYREQK